MVFDTLKIEWQHTAMAITFVGRVLDGLESAEEASALRLDDSLLTVQAVTGRIENVS
jgi:hypothetical protein